MFAAAFLVILSACAPTPPLDTKGHVSVWAGRPDPGIAAAASLLQGITLEEAPRDVPWQNQIGKQGGPDLVLTEWGRDLVKANDSGLILDLTDYWPRLSNGKYLWPGFQDRLFAKTLGSQSFLPLTVYLWGLWYNKDVLDRAGLSLPNTLADLEKDFQSLASRGVQPLALGAAPGWPTLSLISLLDVRYNGPEAYLNLLGGRRSFDDASLMPVFEILTKWRDRGWIDPQAGQLDWPDALAKVDKGQAAFILMSAIAADRFSRPQSIGFMGLPTRNSRVRRGELAVVQGFAVSAGSKAPEAAIALADAYVGAGAEGQTADEFHIAAVSRSSLAAGKPTPVKQAQSLLLSQARALVPQMDRFLPSRTAYDMNQVMVRFFSHVSPMDAAGLARALRAVWESR